MIKVFFYSVCIIEFLFLMLLEVIILQSMIKEIDKYEYINKQEWEEIKSKNIELKRKLSEEV